MHKRDERIGFISSLSVHVLLFFIGGVIFVKTAQYSVQTVAQNMTVELVEAVRPPPVIEETAPPKPKPKVEIRKQGIVKHQERTSRAVKAEANPDYFQNPPPEYPELAKQMRQEGLVMLSVDVDRAGDPINVEIIKSSGFPLLDQAALRAVRHWKFQPGSIGSIPVDSTVTIPIRFRLEK